MLGIDETEYDLFVEGISNKFNLTPGEEISKTKAGKLDNEFLQGLKDKDLYSFNIM